MLAGARLSAGLVLAALALAGCSSPSESVPGGLVSAADPTVSTDPGSGPSSSVDQTSDPASDPATTAGSSLAPPTPTPATPSVVPTRPALPKGQAAIRMQPPTLVSVSTVGCEPLTGGGHRATFLVGLSGGVAWALLPELGPATANGDGTWTVVIEQASGSSKISLRHVSVGGGSPFTTALITLPADLVQTANC